MRVGEAVEVSVMALVGLAVGELQAAPLISMAWAKYFRLAWARL